MTSVHTLASPVKKKGGGLVVPGRPQFTNPLLAGQAVAVGGQVLQSLGAP
jgi:hypothetical protein